MKDLTPMLPLFDTYLLMGVPIATFKVYKDRMLLYWDFQFS